MRLVTVTAGGREANTALCLGALGLNCPEVVADTVVVRHREGWAELGGGEVVLDEGARKAEALMRVAESRDWRVWHHIDDDVLVGPGYFERMEEVLRHRSDIGLLGSLNEGVNRPFGHLEDVGDEKVQFGDDFCVGGASWVLTAEAFERTGGLRTDLASQEDMELTNSVRANGLLAAIAYIPAVHCLDADPSYRPWRREQWNQGLATLGLPPDPRYP